MSDLETQLEELNASTTDKATWTTADVNNLPDSAFLFVESGGKKDGEGKTEPRSLRHFPYKNADGAIDLPHLRNAIARIPQSNAPGLNKGAVQARAQKLLEEENNKKKEAQDPSLLAQLVEFLTGWAHKEGKRNSASDADRLQKAHDLLVENGAQCTLKVFKGEDGKWRWVTVSSTAFKDRDNEIVSTQALDEDVALADQTKEYGPLRWWHVDGLDLGKCDYNAMSGKMLIESGTFNNDAIGNSIKEAADEIAVSIGFDHPPTEPDADGVFHHIRRFERSLLPAGKASNLFTQLAVAKEKTDMTLLKEKFDELAKIIGKEQAEALTKKTDETEKAAEAAGVTFKAESEKAGTDGAEEGLPTTMKGFNGAVLKCMKEFTDAQAEHGKSLKAFGDWQAAHDKAHGEKKEADPVAEKAAQESAAEIALLKEAVTTATARIAELEGSTPRSAKGFRPTQEASTLHKGEDPQGPQPNEAFKDFTSWMVTGSGGAKS